MNIIFNRAKCPRCGTNTLVLQRYSIEAKQREIGVIPNPKLYSTYTCYNCETELILTSELKNFDVQKAIENDIDWLKHLKYERKTND